jgi:hypothetical protein
MPRQLARTGTDGVADSVALTADIRLACEGCRPDRQRSRQRPSGTGTTAARTRETRRVGRGRESWILEPPPPPPPGVARRYFRFTRRAKPSPCVGRGEKRAACDDSGRRAGGGPRATDCGRSSDDAARGGTKSVGDHLDRAPSGRRISGQRTRGRRRPTRTFGSPAAEGRPDARGPGSTACPRPGSPGGRRAGIRPRGRGG